MSIDMLRHWEKPYLHTALDDLESFIWVLVVVSIEIQLTQERRDERGRSFLSLLKPNNIEGIVNLKYTLRSVIFENKRLSKPNIPLSILPLLALIRDLFDALDRSTQDLEEITQDDGHITDNNKFGECITSAYKDFIDIGLNSLSNLNEKW